MYDDTNYENMRIESDLNEFRLIAGMVSTLTLLSPMNLLARQAVLVGKRGRRGNTRQDCVV